MEKLFLRGRAGLKDVAELLQDKVRCLPSPTAENCLVVRRHEGRSVIWILDHTRTSIDVSPH